MYPPRSQKKRSGKKNRKLKQRRLWLTVNAVLLLMIVSLVSYYFLSDQSVEGVQQPKPASPDSTVDLSGGNAGKTAKTTESAGTSKKPAEENPPAKSNDHHTENAENEQRKDQSVASGDDGEGPAGTKQEDSKAPDKHNIAKDNGRGVTIHFVGDMIFSGKVETLLEQKGYSYPFTYLGDTFKKDDLTLGNLETPVTTGGVSAKNKQFVFKASPKALDALHAAGMDVVNLGNNHILDQGEVGLLDTIKYLEQSGIEYVGAGKTAARAYQPQFFKRGGMTIAVIGCSRVYPEPNWAAGDNKPGVASAYDKASRVVSSIAEARKKADLVIVMAHWGIERSLTPNDIQKKLAHDFIDAGADLIIGGHPHVLQGLEQYKGKWIAYSTGNFIFTKSSVPATWKTAVFEAKCKPGSGCSMKLVPYHAELGQPVPMNAQEGSQLMQELQKISIGGVKISGDGVVTPGS
ncbi:CapA family protein [Paenibacillus sp.]|jgi:poly-gamma-glutamate synthesis protein (capsule biosynthesis protein)|uniref:CapA family protein n=1 Tax=Paenibacillus sp. TaxID=58172 RepID=UPI002825AB53|nr:CapA family protein [Paenibacillus sp.]MDR0270604.1 CapA family protein [Paenibacillus sp.]